MLTMSYLGDCEIELFFVFFLDSIHNYLHTTSRVLLIIIIYDIAKYYSERTFNYYHFITCHSDEDFVWFIPSIVLIKCYVILEAK